MSPMDWLRSVRENGQKRLIPPVPPEATPCENAQKALIPPVTPCSSLYLKKREENFSEQAEPELWFGEEKVETSGCHRGEQGVYRGNDELDHRGHRGNQGKTVVSDTAPPPVRPKEPFLTAGGDLSIPFDSDPKYHWWKGGQSVKQTRAEILARMEAQRGQVAATATVTPE
jgi:hypothetical protein